MGFNSAFKGLRSLRHPLNRRPAVPQSGSGWPRGNMTVNREDVGSTAVVSIVQEHYICGLSVTEIIFWRSFRQWHLSSVTSRAMQT